MHTQYQRVYDDVARKLNDNDMANQTNLLANNTAQLTHGGDNSTVALGQADASHDHDSSQSEEDSTKRMKGSTTKDKKHHKKHKKHKHGKDGDKDTDTTTGSKDSLIKDNVDEGSTTNGQN